MYVLHMSLIFSGYLVVTVTTKYPNKVNDVCKAYIDTFNQDAVGLRVSEPMRFVTKVSEVF